MKCPKRLLVSLYYSLFHSHLSYGISVWGNARNEYLDTLRLMQKRAIRLITSSDFHASTSELFRDTKILKLDDIFTHQL